MDYPSLNGPVKTLKPHIEIHSIADASATAYAAVVYLRVTSPTEDIKVTILAGKSKVAPVTPLSIPRLKLSAAVLLARLIQFIRHSTISQMMLAFAGPTLPLCLPG